MVSQGIAGDEVGGAHPSRGAAIRTNDDIIRS